MVFTGLTAIAGWIGLILYALGGRGGPANPTDDFVERITSNALLVHAEVDKIIAILLTTLVLALAISRARHLLVQAVSESTAAQDLSRFFDPGVAARIRGAAISVKAGEGELRDAAILTVDLRGFTRLSTELQPAEVMKVLEDYQGRVCPLIAAAGGNIDKFLGDGYPGLVRRGDAFDHTCRRCASRRRRGHGSGGRPGLRSAGPTARPRSRSAWRSRPAASCSARLATASGSNSRSSAMP